MKKTFTKIMLLLFAMVVGYGNARAAEGDTHDFSQSISQGLNNGQKPNDISISAQSYPVKEVIITYAYNKSNNVTCSVSVGGTSWGTKTFSKTANLSTYTTLSFTGTSAQGAIVVSFANNTVASSGMGTLNISNVRLVEGPSGGGTYSVTYNKNGNDVTGNVPTDPTQYSSTNNTVTVLGNVGDPNLSRTHYSFGGWCLNADGTGTVYGPDEGQTHTYTISESKTFYAKWNPNTNTVTLPAEDDKGTYTMDKSNPVAYNTEVTLTYTPKTGYENYEATWTVKDSDNNSVTVTNNKFTMPDKNVTVTVAVAVPTSWTYTHAANDGTGSTSGTWVYVSDSKFAMQQTKSGNTDIVTNQSEIRLYASHSLEISRNSNFDKVMTSVVVTCNSGYADELAGAAYKAGTSSSSTSTLSSSCVTYSNDIVIIDLSGVTNCAYLKITPSSQSRFTKVVVNYTDPSYTITYSNNLTNGAFATTGNPSSAKEGDAVNIATVPVAGYKLATMTYSHGGNNYNASVNGNNGSFTMPAANVTVNATFETDATTYTITYKENGTTTYVDANIPSGTIGANLRTTPQNTLPANITFVGWAETQIATYTDSEPTLIDITYSVYSNATFYAVYKYDYSYNTLLTSWCKVTDDSSLSKGDKLVIASDTKEKVAGDISSQIMSEIDAKDLFDDGVMLSLPNNVIVLTLGGEEDEWTLANSDGELLGATDVKKLAWDNGTTTWSISITSGNATIQNGTSGYGRFLHNVNNTRFTTYTSETSTSMLLPQLYRLENKSTTISGTYYLCLVTEKETEEITTSTTWSGNNTIKNNELIYINGGSLTVGGLLISPSVDNIYIDNNGQLKVANDGVMATIGKDIEAWNNNDTRGWYTIASPIGNVATANVTNLLSNSSNQLYNLYRYDEPTALWIGNAGFSQLDKDEGYLYRNNDGRDISFTGAVNVSNVTGKVLSYTSSVAEGVRGFHLLGNPFAENITVSNITGATITGVYVLSNAGAWGATVTEIKPCEGFLVQINEKKTITINKPAIAKGTIYNHEYIQFIVANNQYEDVTFAMFDNGNGLNKINHRNSEIPMIYIPQNNQDYAIAMMKDDTKSFNLNFKAMTTGKYTITYKATGEYNYLHIIDRLTGADVDMLIDGEYSFIATPNDNENRFIVNLEYMPNYSEGNNEIFAYQNGNEILVSGEGELQIFDVTGRSVMISTISGAESINLSAKGVYILRLVGNEIKTQKIVVR